MLGGKTNRQKVNKNKQTNKLLIFEFGVYDEELITMNKWNSTTQLCFLLSYKIKYNNK